MNKYYVNGLENRKVYSEFITYMLHNSNAFSFIYFKYKNSEKNKKSVLKIKTELLPYKIYTKNVNKWPGTESQDYGHIYRMTVYRSDIKVESILKQVEHLYAWNYPAYPMDLCFYKDGFAWFWSSSHEGISCFYSDDKIAQELNELGVELQLCKKINKLELYYDPKTIY